MGRQDTDSIPRGIEVLVKKAAVDPQFRAALLERRAAAAEQIGLSLDPSEAAMLRAVPREQLEAIIARTTVPEEQRRIFLGKVAAVSLAALGLSSVACMGVRPDRLPDPKGMGPDTAGEEGPERRDEDPTRGIRPDRPKPREEPPEK